MMDDEWIVGLPCWLWTRLQLFRLTTPAASARVAEFMTVFKPTRLFDGHGDEDTL
jgi:hypothetical protein